MTYSTTPLRLPRTPEIASPAAITWSKDTNTLQKPLDLLIVTSQSDFHGEVPRLLDEAGRKGLQAEVQYVEDLEGSNEGEQLYDLSRKMGVLKAGGRLRDSTVCYVALHGGVNTQFSSWEQMCDRRSDLAAFVHYLGREDPALAAEPDDDVADSERPSLAFSSESDSEDDDDAIADSEQPPLAFTSESDSENDNEDSTTDDSSSSDRPPIHFLSVGHNQSNFPTDLFCLALRHAQVINGECMPAYQGPVILGSCHAGLLRESLSTHDGAYLMLAGTKPGFSSDMTECMLEAIDMMAEQKRQSSEPLTALDYWKRFAQISGEHIACIQEAKLLVHKPAEQPEPVPTVPGSRAVEHPERVLKAKLMHGSAKSVEAVFDMFGRQRFARYPATKIFESLVQDTTSPRETLRDKLQLLADNGFGLPDNATALAEIIEDCLRENNAGLLLAILQPDGGDALPEALRNAVAPCFDKTAVPPKLQSLCERVPELGQAVGRWLVEGIAALQANKRLGLGLTAYPHLLELAFKERCAALPEATGQAIRLFTDKLSQQEATRNIADEQKFVLLCDPADWLRQSLMIRLVTRPDLADATMLMSLASTLASPADLRDTLRDARKFAAERGNHAVAGFLREQGLDFPT